MFFCFHAESMEQKTQKANNYFMLCEIYFVTNYTQEKTATIITREKEADYVFTVKDNQPTLTVEIKNALAQSAFSP